MYNGNGKTLVMQHGTLIDGSGRPATTNEAIVIEGNRIRSVGRLPEDVRLEDQDHVQVIDATEHWIMPGLIDGHCHLSFGFPQMAAVPSARGTTNPGFSALRAARNAQQVLRAGVTSLAVPGGTWFIDVALRDAITAGLYEGPRIACAGRFIITYGSIIDNEPSWVGTPEHTIGVLANNVDEMITEVRRQCKYGVNFIKLADSTWGENPWRWTPQGQARVLPAETNVIVLKPGQIHSLRVSFDDPRWSVSKIGKPEEAKRLSGLRQEWNARFRFEYRPPDRAASEGLSNGNLIWHGRLASRMFSPAGGTD